MAELITDLKNRNMELQFRVNELEAENARLRDALKEVADGEIYPQQVARAALYA